MTTVTFQYAALYITIVFSPKKIMIIQNFRPKPQFLAFFKNVCSHALRKQGIL